MDKFLKFLTIITVVISIVSPIALIQYNKANNDNITKYPLCDLNCYVSEKIQQKEIEEKIAIDYINSIFF